MEWTTVRIVEQGDSELVRETVVELDYFLEIVEEILRNGGEMPVGIPLPGRYPK